MMNEKQRRELHYKIVGDDMFQDGNTPILLEILSEIEKLRTELHNTK